MKISAQFRKMISGVFGMLFLLTPLTVFAQNRVVVIPLFGDDAKPLKNIITVAKANGNFTNPVAAVNSIKDASKNNPYLVVIGPGVYTIAQTLVMKEYVDIVGSGENVTRIKGAISTGIGDASSAIISGADNSTLSALTVENTGGNSNSIGLYDNNASPTISNATVLASGGTFNIGIFNTSSSPTMTDVTATASGPTYNYGVYNFSSSPTMTGVIATASGGTYNYGVYNSSSSPTMTDVTVTTSGSANYNYGVYNSSSSPTMIDVTVTASGGTYSHGVDNFSSSPSIRRSTIKGDTYSLRTQVNAVTISQSTLLGPVSGAGLNKCVACDDGNGTALGADCQ